jgi:uncharacterized protein
MIGVTPHERANLAPFFAFLGLLLFGEVIKSIGEGYAHWGWAHPQYWVFPIQIVVCGGMLLHYRKYYAELKVCRGIGLATLIGAIALGIWIAPQWIFGTPPRLSGFQPHFFAPDGWPYWLNLSARFFRLVVIVPIIEELFWRGFLLRYCIREDFENVAFGTFTWKSFLIVSVAFCFEHTPPDWPAALFTSALYNVAAYRTRSLLACVVAHAITNFLLGLYVLKTQQWGFW